MLPRWDTVIEPFLSALPKGPIVEIGAARGQTTEKLAELAAERGIILHTVDPAPAFDVAEYERRFGEHFRFHEQKSHEALEGIGPVAAAIVDGDHNWYTVHGELTRLERLATDELPFPLVLLHDVEWPYARRDMYYEPDAVPDVWRRPWARRGIRLGQSALDEDGTGVNPRFANAVEEGGPCNGVLTAVEDFIEGSVLGLNWRIVRGRFGLGILVLRDSLAALPTLRGEWERIHSTEFLLAEAERLSKEVMVQGVARQEAERELDGLRREAEVGDGKRP